MDECISVIVPVYKAEKYLKKCLDSIINQTYKDLEIILIDDGSPDNSGTICDEYAKKDKRIKVIHKENGGDSSARNVGLKEATGKYITTIDSDDWIEIDAYEKMLNVLQKYKVDIVRCGFFKNYENRTESIEYIYPENRFINLKTNRYEFMDILASKKAHAGVCQLLIKKEIVDKTSGFCEDVVIGQDLIFEFDLICTAESLYLYNERFYHYYTNLDSATRSIQLAERNVKNLMLLYEKICAVLEKNGMLQEEITKTLATSCFHNIYSQLTLAVYSTKQMDIVNYTVMNEKLSEIINSLDRNRLSKCGRIFEYLIRHRYNKILYYYCILIYWLRNKLYGV